MTSKLINYRSSLSHTRESTLGVDLLGYVTGSITAPAKYSDVARTTLNPAYTAWFRQDQIILSAILGSLSEVLQTVISSAASAWDAWTQKWWAIVIPFHIRYDILLSHTRSSTSDLYSPSHTHRSLLHVAPRPPRCRAPATTVDAHPPRRRRTPSTIVAHTVDHRCTPTTATPTPQPPPRRRSAPFPCPATTPHPPAPIRFLYPVYPLICVAASAVIESFPDIFHDKYNPNDPNVLVMISKFIRPVALVFILCASHARTFSLINGYSAPLEIYKHLSYHDDVGTALPYVLGVSGIVSHHPSWFLVMWIMFDSGVSCHSRLILVWVGLQQHHLISTIRRRHQTSNIYMVLVLLHS
ncbi:PREDICTED: uncharacterized protein LOC109157458 [Ipomoea nil]|uniref:uncharacterized protein LOC109157458 n=1 Tax=Ipomoea nil TaxID=35883 RepID=UPI000900A425|nr:PREDICTED: uncharacterized protein LOC109157458 [Ipomoea nil]